VKEEIIAELWRIVENCSQKRKGLLRLAARTARTRKWLSLTAGILALFSAGSAITVLINEATNGLMNVLTPLLATASGIISVLSSLTLKDTEQQQLYEGAARYLGLRDRTHRLLMNKGLATKQAEAALEEIQKNYAELDATYMRYLVAGPDGGPLSSAGPRPPGADGEPPQGLPGPAKPPADPDSVGPAAG
jgi:hypothetical protein